MTSVIENEAAVRTAIRERQRTMLRRLITKMPDASLIMMLNQETVAAHFRCYLEYEIVWRRLFCGYDLPL